MNVVLDPASLATFRGGLPSLFCLPLIALYAYDSIACVALPFIVNTRTKDRRRSLHLSSFTRDKFSAGPEHGLQAAVRVAPRIGRQRERRRENEHHRVSQAYIATRVISA